MKKCRKSRCLKKTIKGHWDEYFGTAMYACEKRRQENLRRPSELPVETDLTLVRNYCISQMNEMVSDQYRKFSVTEFNRLRAVVVTRLTVFNARRGGEPARLKLQKFQDAVRNE